MIKSVRDNDRFQALLACLPAARALVHRHTGDRRSADGRRARPLPALRRRRQAGRHRAGGGGDAWACTNPSAGRGLSVGAMQVQLCRTSYGASLGDPEALAGRGTPSPRSGWRRGSTTRCGRTRCGSRSSRRRGTTGPHRRRTRPAPGSSPPRWRTPRCSAGCSRRSCACPAAGRAGPAGGRRRDGPARTRRARADAGADPATGGGAAVMTSPVHRLAWRPPTRASAVTSSRSPVATTRCCSRRCATTSPRGVCTTCRPLRRALIDASDWSLSVGGAVARTLRLDLDGLRSYPKASLR